MYFTAKLTSKGQITVPKAVRDTLALSPGHQMLFRVAGNRATVAPSKDFLDLADSVVVPPGKRVASRRVW